MAGIGGIMAIIAAMNTTRKWAEDAQHILDMPLLNAGQIPPALLRSVRNFNPRSRVGSNSCK